MRVKRIVALGMTMVVLTTGCQKAPEDAAVKEKNLDKMIEQAKDAGEGLENPESVIEKYNTYQNNFSNEKLGVKVKANAKVEIPKTDKMSIVRVKQKKITQEFLDKVKSSLNINQKLYDGQVKSVKTKADIEEEIQYEKKSLEEALTNIENEDYREEGISEKEHEEEIKSLKQDYAEGIKELQKEYDKAPKAADWNKYPSSGKIEKDDEKSSSFHGISDGKDGNKTELFALNNEDYGNCIRYYSGKNGCFNLINSFVVGESLNMLTTNDGMWKADRKPTDEDTRIHANSEDLYEVKNEPNTLSENQAKEMAESFLNKIGLTDFQYDDGGLYCELVDAKKENKTGYRKVWVFQYLRKLDNVFVNNEYGYKEQEGWQGNDYVKKSWTSEKIMFCINDQGIVTFIYSAPIEITETVVEKAKLKSFDKIQKNFEKMVTTVYAQNQEEEKEEVTLNVDKVVLRYTRISEKDNFDTGLLVPVWDFMGTIKFKYGLRYDDSEGSIMTINAIDGTVINSELGY